MLENWFVLDHILFGGIPKSYLSESDYKKYLDTKKSYLQTLFEMYNFVGYTSKYIDCPESSVDIQVRALKSVRESRQLTARTLVKEAKQFSKILTESKSHSNKDIEKLRLSCMFENSFITSQLHSAKRPNNMNSPKFILLKNCLTECKKEMINLSVNNMK